MQPCLFCGVKYKSVRPKKYCSVRCRDNAWKALNREKLREKNKQYMREKRQESQANYEPIYLVCVFCDKKFEQSKYHPEQKFCSSTCGSKWYKKQPENRERILRQKRKSNARNKAHLAEYNRHYKNKLRFSGNQLRALNRDKFTCQNCSKSAPDVNLVVHHIDFSGQTEKPNNLIQNLQTLCRPCHIRIHTHKL